MLAIRERCAPGKSLSAGRGVTAVFVTSRMVKISIRANFQINATVLTANDANQNRSLIQRRQPQRPAYKIQASCADSGGADSVATRISLCN